MSTPSVVAIPAGDGWRGRYCHSDGYPMWNGRNLWLLVRRDGLEAVRRVLVVDNYGWSFIKADRPDLTGVVPDEKDYGTPGYAAYEWGRIYDDGRYRNVPGYGVAYTDTKITEAPIGSKAQPYQQVTEDEWFTSEQPADTAWAYVLADHALLVLAWAEGNTWQHVAEVLWDGPSLSDDDWSRIECGDRFERCSHVEGYHKSARVTRTT